jgi:hypothetical protein
MNTPAATIDDVLAQYKTIFENLAAESYAEEFRRIYADNIYFKDPFNEVRGHAAVGRIFHHMFTHLHQPQFFIHAMAGSGQTGFLEWRFRYQRGVNTSPQQINGMSKILIDDQGRVIVHIDYWDSGEYLLRRLPVIKYLNNWVAKRLKAG